MRVWVMKVCSGAHALPSYEARGRRLFGGIGHGPEDCGKVVARRRDLAAGESIIHRAPEVANRFIPVRPSLHHHKKLRSLIDCGSGRTYYVGPKVVVHVLSRLAGARARGVGTRTYGVTVYGVLEGCRCRERAFEHATTRCSLHRLGLHQHRHHPRRRQLAPRQLPRPRAPPAAHGLCDKHRPGRRRGAV
jgi:hypothetical protein